ncbi:hypothetical protein Tco_1540663 [Tanacetum coccineum]
MRRVGKGFSGRVTLLFPTMVVQNQSELGENEAVHKELGDSLVRAATSAFCLEAECQETMGDTTARTRFESVSKNSNDSLLARARVESSGDEESLGEDASKLGRRINAIDADEDITLVNVQDDADNEMFDVNVLNGEEVFVAGQNENVVDEVVVAAQVSTAATTVTITTEEITLAQALEALKTLKPKVKGIVFQEPSTTTTITTISSQQSHDKGKGIIIDEPIKPMKKKDQINDIQAKIDADHHLAKRLQAREQEELSDAEKATLFQQLLEKRRKYFAAKRAEEKRNKPPIKAQQRQIMCTYLKNMEGYKLKDLKSKGFDSIQEMFNRAFKRVNTFEDFRTELVEGKEKRAGE